MHKRKRRGMIPLALASLTLLAGAHVQAEQEADTGAREPSPHEKTLLNRGVINDAYLDARVEALLLANPHLNSFAIDTLVEHRVVTLTGTVESDIDRSLAGEVARSVEGIQRVRNELAVRATPEGEEGVKDTPVVQHVKDARTTAIVKGKLLANPHTHGLSIYIDTRHNVVTLSGTVASGEERQLAELLARNTDSVEGVENNLVVAN